jgi:hypothetical protein
MRCSSTRASISHKPHANMRVKLCAIPRSFALIGERCSPRAGASFSVGNEIFGYQKGIAECFENEQFFDKGSITIGFC